MSRYAVCGALALCVLSLVVLAPVRLAAAAPRAQASNTCSGSITVQLAGVRQSARGITTRNVSCAAGKGVVRSFLQRANRQPSCRSAALQPPPTSGCVVSGYHCFLRLTVNYCATPSGREVAWGLFLASARCSIRRGDQPFVREITAKGVACATAQAAVQVWDSTPPVRAFRAAGRTWTWTRILLRGFPPIVGTSQRMRTYLRSGRVEVVVLSLPYG
jgi:hypothetical protein